MNILRILIVWGVEMAKDDCKKYLWLHGYRGQLSKRITKKDGLLPVVAAADLWARLAGGYSFLTISDGATTEVVRVEQFGNDIKIMRGAENTQAQAFPAGACVVWEVCESGVRAACCVEKTDDDNDCGCV